MKIHIFFLILRNALFTLMINLPVIAHNMLVNVIFHEDLDRNSSHLIQIFTYALLWRSKVEITVTLLSPSKCNISGMG